MKSFFVREGFSYLPASPRYLQLYSVGMEAYFNLIRGAKASGDYDYVIVDTDGGFGNVKATLFSIADRAVIVSRSSPEGDARLAMLHEILDSDSNKDQVLYARNFVEQAPQEFSGISSGSGEDNIFSEKAAGSLTAGKTPDKSIAIEKTAEPRSLADLGKIGGIRELALRILSLPEVTA